jgi:hypothetical protein
VGVEDAVIHDAKVEVTCDGNGCMESIEICPDYVYFDYSGNNGGYDTSNDAIEKKLDEFDWVVIDGKHLCESCQPEEDDEA